MFGTPVDSPIRGLQYLFPRPDVLAHADLSKAGISHDCANTMRKLTSSTIGRNLSFATSRTLEQVVSKLGAIGGINESMANYIAMRAFGEPDAFPSNEFESRRCLSGLRPNLSCAEALAEAERWRPWRAYAAMHLAQKIQDERSIRPCRK
jgi:AraC family transcriptional regulator of adaptative response / DNA-3-methyladenine glycosylase II